MILTFDLETWFRVTVTAHPLPVHKDSLLVNSEKDWAKGKEIMVLNWISKRSGMTFALI